MTTVCSFGAGNFSLWDCLTVFSCLKTMCEQALFGVGVVLSDLQLIQVERAMFSCFKVSTFLSAS